MEKHRYFYYCDELNDDFANNGIETRALPDDYEYYPSSLAYRLVHPIANIIMLIFLMGVNALTDGYRVRNARVLKNRKDRRKGYFVFANHTTWVGDAVIHPTMAFPKQVYTVVHPDAISIKGASTAIRMLGAMPKPASRRNFVRFLEAAERMYNEGNPVVIYPEAHIWPKYNKIRPFPDVSFGIPARLGAPCFVKTTVYRLDKKGHSYSEVYYDGPLYPDSTLGPKEAKKKLRDEVYTIMCGRTQDSCLDKRYHYIKVSSPEEVRTEIKEMPDEA